VQAGDLAAYAVGLGPQCGLQLSDIVVSVVDEVALREDLLGSLGPHVVLILVCIDGGGLRVQQGGAKQAAHVVVHIVDTPAGGQVQIGRQVEEAVFVAERAGWLVTPKPRNESATWSCSIPHLAVMVGSRAPGLKRSNVTPRRWGRCTAGRPRLREEAGPAWRPGRWSHAFAAGKLGLSAFGRNALLAGEPWTTMTGGDANNG